MPDTTFLRRELLVDLYDVHVLSLLSYPITNKDSITKVKYLSRYLSTLEWYIPFLFERVQTLLRVLGLLGF